MEDYLKELTNDYPRIFRNKKFKISHETKHYIKNNVSDFDMLLLGIIEYEVSLDGLDEIEIECQETLLEGGTISFIQYCHNSIIIDIIKALTVENMKLYD